jgi:hypothetical protein
LPARLNRSPAPRLPWSSRHEIVLSESRHADEHDEAKAERSSPHHGKRLVGRAAAMLAGLRLADPQLRMLAASPMDRQSIAD